MTPELEQFAKMLMRHVRDASIRSNDVGLRSTAVGPIAGRWAKAAKEESPVDFARVIIPDAVDDTIFYLLHAIDEGALHLSFTVPDGTGRSYGSGGQRTGRLVCRQRRLATKVFQGTVRR